MAQAAPTTATSGKRVEIDFSVYNPYDPDFIRDPHPTWNRLLEHYPVAWHRDMKTWVVAPHDLCFEALRSPKFSLSFRDYKYAPPKKPESQWTDFDRAMEYGLGVVSPKEHIRLRKLTQPAFARQVMDQIEIKIQDLIEGIFDDIGTPKEFNVASAIAARVSVPSIARMVGVSKEAEQLFEEGLSYNLVRATNPLYAAQFQKHADGTLPGFAFLKELVAERRARKDKGNDFIGTLLTTVDDEGDHLSDWDIIALIAFLITAGADTAVDLHSCAIQALLTHPDQRRILHDNPQLMENAILEILRWGFTGKIGPQPRYPLQDMEFGGQWMEKGEPVMVLMPAAWVDPKKWPEPRKFDINRNQDGNIIFGAGAHFCIGLNLVKVQGRLMINEFNKRFPKAELTGDIEHDPAHFNMRRITKLMVKTNLN